MTVCGNVGEGESSDAARHLRCRLRIVADARGRRGRAGGYAPVGRALRDSPAPERRGWSQAVILRGAPLTWPDRAARLTVDHGEALGHAGDPGETDVYGAEEPGTEARSDSSLGTGQIDRHAALSVSHFKGWMGLPAQPCLSAAFASRKVVVSGEHTPRFGFDLDRRRRPDRRETATRPSAALSVRFAGKPRG